MEHQQQALKVVVPWFCEQMPETYFRQTAPEAQALHLRAIAALGWLRDGPGLQLSEGESGQSITFLSRGSVDGVQLQDQLAALPRDAGLRHMRVYSSADGTLGLSTFELSQAGEAEEPRYAGLVGEEQEMRERLRVYLEELNSGKYVGQEGHPPPSAVFSDKSLDDFLRQCSSRYVCQHLPRLLCKQFFLWKSVAGTDDVKLDLEHNYKGTSDTLLTMASEGMPPRITLERSLALTTMAGVPVRRAQVDSVGDDNARSKVTLLRMLVSPPTVIAADGGARFWDNLTSSLRRSKFLGDTCLSLATTMPTLGLQRAEVVTAIADLSLSVLDHPLLSRELVSDKLRLPVFEPFNTQLAELFLRRFDPAAPLEQGAFDEKCDGLVKLIEETFSAEESRRLARTMVSALQHSLKTNVHVPTRYSLAIRLNPTFFEPALPPPPSSGLSNVPYGVFFCAGRHFNGYHVRFRDVARGGMRVVLTSSEEQHNQESRRHFNECFSLAWAQQLKNKDIPEGGSKAVCLVSPVTTPTRERVHNVVKAFTDGLLDLLTPDAAVRANVVDYLGRPETLYLGPDENIVPEDIDWVVNRAAVRGYPVVPAAFMSSKPATGINHKEFGVTSEGVAVFLDSALRSLGIKPAEEPWTIKLTGGPDGDVAGNMLKILHREYGEHCRVVGLADGTGCAEDPDGLDMGELLRLFHEASPLSAFDPSALGPRGELHLADTPEGAQKRNSMHNRVVADAFVPAGGRPSTINGSNWREFLLEDGVTPSARVVVEGANLFLTHEARASLFEASKLPIVKDSSANKCGVICSSLEIVSSLMLTGDEFIALKSEYVPQVLERLRELARSEADLLFAEYAKQPAHSLVHLSERVSTTILRVADALSSELDTFDAEAKGRFWPLTQQSLPSCLVNHPSARLEELPWEYQRALISSALAGRLVYREGLQFVESLDDARLATWALAYLQHENQIRTLADRVAESNLEGAESIEKLLRLGGTRTAAEHSLSL